MDTVQTGESYECGHGAKKRKYSPNEQADKTCSRARVSLGFAFSHFGALKRGWEERCRVGLLCDGQVGAEHWKLACWLAELATSPLNKCNIPM